MNDIILKDKNFIYLWVLKELVYIFFITVDIQTNCGSETIGPTKTKDYARTSFKKDPQTLQGMFTCS